MAEIINDTELESVTKSFALIPSEGGRFEFSVDGALIYSKLQTGRHVEDNELRNLMKAHLAGE
ncbi:MAG: Rdx family protein [Chloroflexota bacterium]